MSTCLVVAAGDGIGAAVARRFAAEGVAVGLVARDRARLERLAATLPGRSALATADVSDPVALGAACAALQGELGPADVLVYNAARARTGDASAVTPDELAAELAVDVVGAVSATRAVLPAMLERGAGTLLFTGGGLALSPAASFAALSVGKAALRAWALALHDDLAPRGIHAATVTVAGMVQPGGPFDPDAIAATYWELHRQPAGAREAERVLR